MSGGAPYAPFLEPRTARPPGLSPLDPAEWLACDPDYAQQMTQRDRLIAEQPDLVMAATDDAADALEELRETVLTALTARSEWRIAPDAVRRPDRETVPLDTPTLPLIGRLLQEDMLLMAPGDPEYRLIGGVLCFPSRWSFAEKLGRPLTEIHSIVPGYAEELAPRVNRVFDAVAVERPLIRVNWAVHPTPALHQPRVKTSDGAAPVVPLTGRFWLRTERQTLRRLPRTRAVAFGIKLTVTPLQALTPLQRAGLGVALRGLSADEIAYRGGADLHAAALDALEG
jgi:hypothetical protein